MLLKGMPGMHRTSQKNLLGNHKDEDYKNIVRILLENFHILGCNMSLKVRFLFSHLYLFPKNLGAISEE
jgi:hypothetical protein